MARAGLAEVHERLLARAENALLEERLDEAAAAIETARKSGVESGRIAFLTAQLAKSREQVKTGAGQVSASRLRTERTASEPEEDHVTPLLELAAQRIDRGASHRTGGRQRALLHAGGLAARSRQRCGGSDAEKTLAMRQLIARSAWRHRSPGFRARLRLGSSGADGIAAAANIDAAQEFARGARRQADTDARAQLLKNANDRLQQDRLIEPANDSAKYYYADIAQPGPRQRWHSPGCCRIWEPVWPPRRGVP